MVTSAHSYPVTTKSAGASRLGAVIRRAPLIMMTVIFSLISFRYLSNPVGGAAAVGISFTSPGGVTIARVGFAGFPLAFAILAFGYFWISNFCPPAVVRPLHGFDISKRRHRSQDLRHAGRALNRERASIGS